MQEHIMRTLVVGPVSTETIGADKEETSWDTIGESAEDLGHVDLDGNCRNKFGLVV